ncbi:hypothetical protein NX059_002507 [Plenodomus lindquistii]|nr:hypothetical protein NX059_002507 [Plenodomus lindquistii]
MVIEDTLLVIATILNLVLSVTTCGLPSYKDIYTSYYGYHVYDIPEGAVDPIVMMKWNYANSVIYNPILALVKTSFLLTLIKLRSQNKWINRCLWATVILNACFAIAAPLACIFQCDPVHKYWDSSIPGECADAGAYTVSTSSVVLATDVLILLMPSWILHDLKMPLGRKLMVIAFLSFGIAVTIVGAVRTSVLVKVFVLEEVVADPTYDVSYTLSNIESGLSIIGTCGPTIKYMLSFCFPALKSAEESTNRNRIYPTVESQGEKRTRRDTRGTRPHETFHEIEEVELTRLGGEHRRTLHSIPQGGDLTITKTVAWRVDGAQQDANSACEQNISTPRNML